MTKTEVKRIHLLTGHRDCVYTLEGGSEPSLFFSGGGDGMVVLWDMNAPETGKLIAQLPNSVYALHYLRDENLLIAGQNFEGIHLLDWQQRKELRSMNLGNNAIFDIQSFGRDLFIASGDGTVSVVDIDTWTLKGKIKKSDKSARTIAVNAANGEIAVGYSDHHIRVFGLDDLALRHEWMAHANSVFTVKYSSDFQTLLSGSRDARLKAWNTVDYTLAQEVIAHLYAINSIDFSPDGKHFVTCSLDKSIKVWDAGQIKLLKVIDKARHAGHGTSVNKLLWTSFNNQLASASDDRTVSIWDLIFYQAPDDDNR